MTITKLKLESPAKRGKSPRVTIAIEPDVAKIFRQLAKHEGVQRSQLLEQALVAVVVLDGLAPATWNVPHSARGKDSASKALARTPSRRRSQYHMAEPRTT